jgi:hypothetical protein
MGQNRKRAEEADSPRHLWRGVRGEVGITGSQSVAPEKLELARKLRRDMTLRSGCSGSLFAGISSRVCTSDASR